MCHENKMKAKFNIGDTIVFLHPYLFDKRVKRTWTKSFVIGIEQYSNRDTFLVSKWIWGSFEDTQLRITRLMLTEKTREWNT